MYTTATERGIAPRYFVSIVAAAILLATQAQSAEFEPQIMLGITHTDNVFITLDEPRDEIIYRAEPSFAFSHDSTRLTVLADYLMQAFRYEEIGDDEVFHQYQASLLGKIVPERFTVELGGSRHQSIVDPELTIPQGNLPLSRNRQDRDEYYITPRFQYSLGTSVDIEAEATASWIENSESTSRNAENRESEVSINNYRIGRGLTWALRHEWRHTEYDNGIPWENQRGSAELGLWLGDSTRVFGTYGLESAWDMPLDPAMEDEFWEAGFAFQLGQRFRGEFAAGERSFGPSWRGNLDFSFKLGSTSLAYSEVPTTQARIPYRRGSFRDDISLTDLLNRPDATNRFVLKALEWRLNLGTSRTRFSLVLFSDERSDQTTDVGDPIADEMHRGVHLSLGYQVGNRTLLFLRGLQSEREYRQGAVTDLRTAVAGVDYDLGPRTSVLLQYNYNEGESETTSSERDYVANTVSLFVTRTF